VCQRRSCKVGENALHHDVSSDVLAARQEAALSGGQGPLIGRSLYKSAATLGSLGAF